MQCREYIYYQRKRKEEYCVLGVDSDREDGGGERGERCTKSLDREKEKRDQERIVLEVNTVDDDESGIQKRKEEWKI